MKKFWLLVGLALMLSAGSASAQSLDKSPARFSALQTALQRQLSPGIRPFEVGGCPPGDPPAISLDVTLNSSIDTSSCPATTPGAPDNLYFDFYEFTVTAGTHVHITGNSAFLNPILLVLTDSADFPTVLAQIFGNSTASIDFTFATGGTYFITISSGTPNATGIYSLLVSTGAGGGCVANSTTLCLQGGRFSVTVAWINQHPPGGTGVGMAVVDTDQTGFFYFSSPQAIDLLVKIIDGRGVTGSFWVFFAALSDLEYTITVTDLQAGLVKTYHNAPGNECGQFDTSFSTTATPLSAEVPSPATASGVTQSVAIDTFPASERVPSGAFAPCVASAQHLCLLSNRFDVSVSWNDQHTPGHTGVGTAVASTDQTGYFWFFVPDSLEFGVKMIDGRAVTGAFWVFYAALSDVEYDITVTDTQTGAVKTYHNAPGNRCGEFDTRAFPSSGTPSGLDPAALAGDWPGVWHNLTFDTTGSADLAISADTSAHTFQATFSLGGSVFGGTPPSPETFSGTYTPGGTGTFTKDSAFYGHVSVTIGADGSVTGSMTSLPKPGIERVDFVGTITATTINITYSITFSAGGTATGTVTLTKS